MNQKRTSFIFVTLILILITAGLYGYKFYEERKVAGVQTNEQPKRLTGMVVPHHKLAHALIDESYKKISQNTYSHIVIFSPNHYYPDAPAVMTASEIPGVSVDAKLLDGISQQFAEMKRDPEMLSGEHGIMLQTEYIRHYFPHARIIPLVLSHVLTREKAEELGHILATTLPEDTLYVASVDFSHNSTIEEGLNKNEETVSVLTNFDTRELYTFGDDHLDAPFATSVWLMALSELGARHFELWGSSHSGIITQDPDSQGTSYVLGGFYQ